MENNMSLKNNKKKFLFLGLAFIICGVVVYYLFSISRIQYLNQEMSKEPVNQVTNQNTQVLGDNTNITPDSSLANNVNLSTIPVTHIQTPSEVKAIYLSAWTAGSAKYRDPLLKIIDDTELNAVVIDIKDSTGRVSFQVSDPELAKMGTSEKRISDIRALTAFLHSKNIYIIGRVSVFQDPYLTKKKPEWAITKKSDGTVWKDHKGLSFLDPANKEVWNYIKMIALDSYAEGFDEINFDYIRYPSDGNMKDINYRLFPGKTRADNIEAFFIYLSSEVKKDNNIPISGDLFGLTTESLDDMGIGQVWEKALPHFDFLAPMVYPSHYPSGYMGYKNPASYPYEVINKAISSAIIRTKAKGENIAKIRPWLQDFDMGATYTKDLIRAQMKAVYDNGLNSWMLWDPANKYTKEALLVEKVQ